MGTGAESAPCRRRRGGNNRRRGGGNNNNNSGNNNGGAGGGSGASAGANGGVKGSGQSSATNGGGGSFSDAARSGARTNGESSVTGGRHARQGSSGSGQGAGLHVSTAVGGAGGGGAAASSGGSGGGSRRSSSRDSRGGGGSTTPLHSSHRAANANSGVHPGSGLPRALPGLPRRPFLQIVVLFASDPRVMQYARSVQAKFLDVGVDVWLMTELPPEVRGSTNGGGDRWVKPLHLVEVITKTFSDCLIVLGDRNMKNDTCQMRKSGKLVEVPVVERIRSLVREWAQRTGLRHVYADPGRRMDPASLSMDQLLERVKDHTGQCSHARDRLRRLAEAAVVLQQWRKSTQNLTAKHSARHGSRGGSSEGGGVPAFSEADQEMISKLTHSQTAAIKLHRELPVFCLPSWKWHTPRSLY